jgi:hypothetical protein
MVTDEKIYNIALIKYRLGLVLIWLGVLTWLPFIMLRLAGQKPSFFWYLPVHLAGVIGGSRLRVLARKEMNLTVPEKNVLQMLGQGMIVSGILVWAPYFYLKAGIHQPVEVMDFLPYHLTGVLGGVILLGISYLISQRNNTNL